RDFHVTGVQTCALPIYFYTYVKAQIQGLILAVVQKKQYKHKAQSFSFNTKFIVLCNMVVLILATVSYYIMEQGFTLTEDKSVGGEWATSFFMANAARSAGFNSVNISLDRKSVV